LFVGEEVALIKRIRAGQCYYLFPGGGVEESESNEDAAKREALEELGVEIRILRLFAAGQMATMKQYYYLAEAVGGKFGTGAGPELASSPSSVKGSYTPVWMKLSDLMKHDVRPQSLAQLIAIQDLNEINEVINVSD
jgi:8-oxo-dGTP pyrophosphatase MutT (NUDIX family)